MNAAGILAAPQTAENPLGCESGRKAGQPIPPWVPSVGALLRNNLEFFPPNTDPAFLLAWIERESDGRHALTSSLGEVGYFQLHPAEIDDIAGRENRDAVIADIKSSPQQSIRWGGMLLQHYDKAIAPFDIPRGTELRHGLLKTMHTSRPRGIAWLKHVQGALGRSPRTFSEFLATTARLTRGEIRSGIAGDLPKLPTCSAFQLLERTPVFRSGSTEGGVPLLSILSVGERTAAVAARSVLWPTLFRQAGTITFPGVNFVEPVVGSHVFSGWGRPRKGRDGVHEGIDVEGVVGTPILSIESGVVVGRSFEKFAGNFLTIRHANGWVSRYMHLGRMDVKVGDSVRRGQVIGTMGRSGQLSSDTPTHLHFDLLLLRSLLPLYSQMFGTPRGGFGRTRQIGEEIFTTVPSESMIPITSYSERTINDARRNGVPLFFERFVRPFPKAALAVFGTIGIAFFMALGALRKRGI